MISGIPEPAAAGEYLQTAAVTPATRVMFQIVKANHALYRLMGVAGHSIVSIRSLLMMTKNSIPTLIW